jgi:hypothetical protein
MVAAADPSITFARAMRLPIDRRLTWRFDPPKFMQSHLSGENKKSTHQRESPHD